MYSGYLHLFLYCGNLFRNSGVVLRTPHTYERAHRENMASSCVKTASDRFARIKKGRALPHSLGLFFSYKPSFSFLVSHSVGLSHYSENGFYSQLLTFFFCSANRIPCWAHPFNIKFDQAGLSERWTLPTKKENKRRPIKLDSFTLQLGN